MVRDLAAGCWLVLEGAPEDRKGIEREEGGVWSRRVGEGEGEAQFDETDLS